MKVDDLLDDEPIDPKKFFDEKEYNTLIVGREGFTKKQNDIADLIETLLSKDVSRQESEETFSKLKELNAQKLLVTAITEANTEAHRAKLCAVCWESGLDFTSHFMFFVKLACSEDFSVAMEALTVVENIEGNISEEELTEALEIAQNAPDTNYQIVEDLRETIKQRIH